MPAEPTFQSRYSSGTGFSSSACSPSSLKHYAPPSVVKLTFHFLRLSEIFSLGALGGARPARESAFPKLSPGVELSPKVLKDSGKRRGSLWRLEESTTTTPPTPQDGIHTPYNRGPDETRSLLLVQAVLLFQGPVLFEDLAVYFSQEECVSLHPAQRSLSREATQECFEDKAMIAEDDKIEINQQLHLESMGLKELALEKCSLAVSLIYYPEKCSEHGAGNFERKIAGGTSACKKTFRSLLVTIENHTPKIELAQSLRTRALPKILPFPKEETKKSYKCPECDRSFSGSSYLVWHQKTHVSKKKCKCDDCGKIFNHRSNLRAHRRNHTGEKPYKCAQCGSSFRQPSHLSQHRKTHLKEKIHRCGICGRGFTRLRGLSQHQKTHTATKAGDKYVEDNLNTTAIEGKLLSFSKFKPLKCPECSKTFLSTSELISHQSTHRGEKPHKPKTCPESFILDSELPCHQKSHTGEEPFKCTRCGRNFRLKTHLTFDQQTHSQNTV
ncbi:zinc finger protein 597 [Oryx dammah]|uniref:zinc finger protein 597 n=1 Tax=Oryx dammah TaxID=59534 RepID=UPI001A9AFB33|nr:zinc finger protein 597 [Oryx dammah]